MPVPTPLPHTTIVAEDQNLCKPAKLPNRYSTGTMESFIDELYAQWSSASNADIVRLGSFLSFFLVRRTIPIYYTHETRL